jgi:glucose/arabinose dehydrogenase
MQQRSIKRFAVAVLGVICAGWVFAGAEYNVAFPNLRFSQPVLITHAPETQDRLYVVEQGGTIQSFENRASVSDSTVFFDIEKATSNRFLTGGEQGLLGLAFDPEYSENGYFYVNYTAGNPRRTVIARYQVDDNQRVQYATETILLEVEQDYANHNGGMIAFGPDGYLYIGMGDGGSGGDPKNRAQDPQSLLGKMLRIDTDGSVPSDNPFVGDETIQDEIWAIGLRNPWRFSFDRETGALWAADVGQNAVEEINRIVRGGNYGWRYYEGSREYNLDSSARGKQFEKPIFEYSHRDGRSVTGGVVYRGAAYPNLQGWYFFGDFVTGAMWMLNTSNNETVTLKDFPNPAAFGEDQRGELYIVSYQGQIYKLVQ